MNNTRPNRLLYVLQGFEITSLNGHVGDLLNYFLEKGTDVTLLTVDLPQPFPSHALLGRIKIQSVKTPWHLALCLLTRLTSYDSVFTYNFSRINFLLWFLKRGAGKRYWIKTDCQVVLPRNDFNPRHWLSDVLNIRLFFRGADVVLVETPALVNKIQRIVPNANVVLFPNCIDTAKIRQAAKHLQLPLLSSKRRYTVLFTGRLMKLKGLEVLIQAFAKVADRYREWDLRIIGPIKDETYFRSLQENVATHSLLERIRFVPPQFDVELDKEYSAADIFCIPSLPGGDGMPMSLIEAMSWGIPVIASAHSAIPFIVADGQAGILFEPGNVEALADALAKCMESADLRRTLGKTAQERVTSHFDWHDAFQRLENALSRVTL